MGLQISKGLISTQYYPPGTVIHTLKGEFTERDKYSVEVEGKHIQDELFKFCNHSFTPNVRIEGYNVISILSIEAGDEITFDYTKNESYISNPFRDSDTGLYVANPINSLEEEERMLVDRLLETDDEFEKEAIRAVLKPIIKEIYNRK